MDSVQQHAGEAEEQLQTVTSRTQNDSSLQNLEKEQLTSKETSAYPQKNVQKGSHRKHLKPCSRKPLKKRKQVSPPQSRENGNKVPFCLMSCSECICVLKTN